MIEASIEFDAARRQGGLVQGALFLRMHNETIIVTDDPIDGIDQTPLLRWDGTWSYDGSVTFGSPVQTVVSGLMSIGALEKGSDLVGTFEIIPNRRNSWSAEIENVSGFMSELLLNESVVAKGAEYWVVYPGLGQPKMVCLFKGEVESYEASDTGVHLEMVSS